MSDVSFANAGWFGRIIFLFFVGIVWLVDSIPVLIRRGEYRRLQDNQLILDDAYRALNENRELRQKLSDLSKAGQP